jgi:hypothetical protein
MRDAMIRGAARLRPAPEQGSPAPWWRWSSQVVAGAIVSLSLLPTVSAQMLDLAPEAQQEPGSLVVRVAGPDALFGFTSATPALNFSIATINGDGQSPRINLPPGLYSLTADNLSGTGVLLTDISCTGGSANANSGTIAFDLSPGKMVDCTVSATNSEARTAELVSGFLTAQGNLLLTTLPASQNRVDRLNGAVALVSSPRPFLESLPGIVAGDPIPVSGSLAALDRLAGYQQQSNFDAWMEGSLGLFGDQPDDRFGILALGTDYRINRDLLVGGFMQMDSMSKRFNEDALMTSLGWTVGAYGTARIARSIYLDLLVGGGSAGNTAQPSEGSTAQFDASRWLLSASVLGDWTYQNWTFTPRASLSYVEEGAYSDSADAEIAAVRAGRGRVAIGPGISYRLTTQSDVVVDAGLRFDTRVDLFTEDDGPSLGNSQGALEGTVNVSVPKGMQWGTTLGYSGIGTDNRVFSARGRLSLPLR